VSTRTVNPWRLKDFLTVSFFLLVGIFFIILPGIRFGKFVPGELGDGRLNNYLLEHFYRWITGWTADLWNAPFFYPWAKTLAFSGNHLGTALIYALFRLIGLDRETAFQGWYLVGYITNYAACGYVLRRLGFSALSSGIGAFVFSFGLPVVIKAGHSQLLYRAGVPLAVLFFFNFKNNPQLKSATFLVAAITWQFYAEIYLGFFLSILIFSLAVATCIIESGSFKDRMSYWPRQLKQAYKASKTIDRFLCLSSIVLLAVLLGELLWPYAWVSKVYKFERHWGEVASMLPRLTSYLLADNSVIWSRLSSLIKGIPMRHEHQLFVGIVPLLLSAYAVKNIRYAGKFRVLLSTVLLSTLAVFLLTLYLGRNLSLYMAVFAMPGFSAIRAVTRIILILLFPLAIFISCAAEILQKKSRTNLPVKSAFYLAIFILLLECIFVRQFAYEKASGQARIARLRSSLPLQPPKDPVLFDGTDKNEPFYYSELDAMLLAQELGWKTINGYSGNFPPGYRKADFCSSAVSRIAGYVRFHSLGGKEYVDISSRLVPVNFTDCNPSSFNKTPLFSPNIFLGPDILKRLSVEVENVSPGSGGNLLADIVVINKSGSCIPMILDRPVRLSWRYVNAVTGVPMSVRDARRDLDFDILAQSSLPMKVPVTLPDVPGEFFLEFSLVQESVVRLHDLGVPVARWGKVISGAASPSPTAPLPPPFRTFGCELFEYAGLSEPEDWGAWSDDKQACIVTAAFLPKSFKLHLKARAFGPNAGVPFHIRVGSDEKTFTLTESFQSVTLQFDHIADVKLIVIDVPRPTSPQEIGLGTDTRKLGIGLAKLRVEPVKRTGL